MPRHYGQAEYGLGYYLTLLVITIAAMIGWVMNVIALWNTIDGPMTAKFIVRVIGVFVPVVGAILGYL